MKKRGQAAMEFLMTYGWAILAAIIVVGVLWYIIGNPSNLAGKQFTLSAPLSANAFNFGTNGASLSLEIRNGAGNQITVSNVSVTGCGNVIGDTISQGTLRIYNVTCTPEIGSGNRFLGDITVYYTTSGSSITQQSTGSISGKVP
jgi:uncharacterized protein (UPF0333 family)